MSSSDLPDPELDLPRMTLSEHLDELRSRLVKAFLALMVAMIVAFVLWEQIWDFVRAPYVQAAARNGIADAKLLSLDPGEGFLSILKLSFLAAFVVAGPIVLWQLWGFIAAGLYPHERRYVRLFFPISVGLFALGVVMAYVVLIPFGFRFLIAWNLDMEGVSSDFRIESYISTCLTMVFGMALLFELPLVMMFLQAVNIVSRKTFQKGWRVAVLLAFVIGMLLTDPSPVTQVAMAMPVCGLYFLGIWAGRFVGDDRIRFRWYHVWPLLLGALLIAGLLLFADDINDRIFGSGTAPPATAPPAPASPADPPTGG